VEVLAHECARLAPEDDEQQPEGVEAGEEGAREARDPEDVAVRAVVHCRGEDRVLREETGERKDPDEGERADQECDIGRRHQPA
jgi:hypothetical protein